MLTKTILEPSGDHLAPYASLSRVLCDPPPVTGTMMTSVGVVGDDANVLHVTDVPSGDHAGVAPYAT